MSITPEQIASTAALAKLKINDDDVAEITQRISAILDLVDQMQAIDTENVEPMSNSLDAVQHLRIDKAMIPGDPVASRDAFQAIAPETEDGLYLVPKVID